MDSLKLIDCIVNTLDDKKANNIQVIRIDDLTVIGDYFVIADADNQTHVRSLVDEVEFQTKQGGRNPRRIEKDESASWIILDYEDVVVHIFYRPTREFYNLENLWSDGETIDMEQFLNKE